MAAGWWRSISATISACSSARRRGRELLRANVITPHSISRPPPGAPFPASTTPYPVAAVPGSTPSTLTSAAHRGHRLGVDVEVGEHLRHVVHLLELLDQPEQPLRVRALDLDRALRGHRDLGRLHRESARLEPLLNGVELARRSRDDQLIAVPRHVLGPRLERDLERGVFIGLPRVHHDLRLAVEHPRDRVGGAQVGAVPGEEVPDLGDGPVRVVGRRLDEDRRAARTVAFVGHVFVLHALQPARALLDGAIDVVPRHVLGLGRLDGGAETRIPGGVAAALPRGDGDFPDQLGEGGAASGVGDGLLPLYLLPFAVAGHTNPNLQRSPVRVEHVFDPHPAPVEVQVHEPRRAVAVLGDQQLGRPLDAAAGVVHLLPEDREHDVGVLFHGAEVAEVVQRGARVRALGVEVGELRRDEQRHLALERQRLELPQHQRHFPAPMSPPSTTRSRRRSPPPRSLSTEAKPVGMVSPVISPGRCWSTRATRDSMDGRRWKRRGGMSAFPVRLSVYASVRLAYYRCMRAVRAATATTLPASGPSTSRAGATSWESTTAAAAGVPGSRCWRASARARFSGPGSARLARRVPSACSRRRCPRLETGRGWGVNSASAARSTSHRANAPSRAGPRPAAASSPMSCSSHGVVARIMRRGAARPPRPPRARCRRGSGGGPSDSAPCRWPSRGGSRAGAPARLRGRGRGRSRTASPSVRTAPRPACPRLSPCASPPCPRRRAPARARAARRSPAARTPRPRSRSARPASHLPPRAAGRVRGPPTRRAPRAGTPRRAAGRRARSSGRGASVWWRARLPAPARSAVRPRAPAAPATRPPGPGLPG